MLKIIRISWPFILAATVFICLKIAVWDAMMIEHFYTKGIYPLIAKWLSSVSSIIPFSLWDLIWVLVLSLIISGLLLVVFKKIKFVWYCLQLVRLFALIYSFFYILWGVNYFRPGIASRMDWEIQNVDELNFRSMLDSIINNTNLSHISFSTSDYSRIDLQIEESYRKNSLELGIDYPNGRRRPKTMMFSSFFAKIGVSGYFGPFFNEIHVNGSLLPMDYPFVLAHEKAHQFGICNEAEANLAAYIICITSEDSCLQYSGYLLMLRYFLAEANRLEDYQEYVNKIERTVITDLRFRYRYYQVLLNKTLDRIQNAANDFYLKNNNIPEGIKSYNNVVKLVLIWNNNVSSLNEGD